MDAFSAYWKQLQAFAAPHAPPIRASPIRASPVRASHTSPCTNNIKTLNEQEPVSIQHFYDLKKPLGGGKSGAYVFLVNTKRGEGESLVLKMYPGTFQTDGTVKNDRPLREIYTLCKMNGEEGFPVLHRTGISETLPWKNEVSTLRVGYGLAETQEYEKVLKDNKIPFVVMGVAPGTTLTNLNLPKLKPRSLLRIADQLLTRLVTAYNKLGKHFQHFDLHPDNIYVKVHNPGTEDERPEVQLIDFDLVRANIFEEEEFHGMYAALPLPEQKEKLLSTAAIPERTLNFVLKWLPKSMVAQLLVSLGKAKKNTDVRNWMAILGVFAYLLGLEHEVVLCKGIHRCGALNRALLSTASAAFRAEINAASALNLDAVLNASVLSFMGEEGGEELLKLLKTLDTQLHARTGQRVNQDVLEIVLEATFPPPTPLLAGSPENTHSVTLHCVKRDDGAKVINVRVGAFEVLVTGKALSPRIELNFKGDGIRIDFLLRDGGIKRQILKKILLSGVWNHFACNNLSGFLSLFLKGFDVFVSKMERVTLATDVPHLDTIKISKIVADFTLGKETEIKIFFTLSATLNSLLQTPHGMLDALRDFAVPLAEGFPFLMDSIPEDLQIPGLTPLDTESGSYMYSVSINGKGEPHVCAKILQEKAVSVKASLKTKCIKSVMKLESSIVSMLENFGTQFFFFDKMRTYEPHVVGRLQARVDETIRASTPITTELLHKLIGSNATISSLVSGSTAITPLIALNLARRLIGVKMTSKQGKTTIKGGRATVQFDGTVSTKDLRKVVGDDLIYQGRAAGEDMVREATAKAAELLGRAPSGVVAKKAFDRLREKFGMTKFTTEEGGQREQSPPYKFPDEDDVSVDYAATSGKPRHKLFATTAVGAAVTRFAAAAGTAAVTAAGAAAGAAGAAAGRAGAAAGTAAGAAVNAAVGRRVRAAAGTAAGSAVGRVRAAARTASRTAIGAAVKKRSAVAGPAKNYDKRQRTRSSSSG